MTSLICVSGAALGQSGNVVVSSNTTWATGTYNVSSLTVQGGAVLTVGGGSTVTVTGAVLVTGSSGIVLQAINNTAQVSGSWQGAGVTMNAASVEVDAGSTINADGQGYAFSAGPGGAPAGLSPGGSYGGLGGFGIDNGGTPISPAAIYGSPTAPTDLGSGGGSRCCGAVGGAGGGAVRLSVTGALTNNGVISANGAAVVGAQSGGGAGGSVYVTAGGLAGAGIFTAKGGAGGEASGGGGRVAVYYNGTASSYSGFANSSEIAGVCGSNCNSGGTGTGAFFDTSATGNNLNVYQNFTVPAGASVSFNSVTVQAGSVLTIGGGATVNVANALTVTGTIVAQSLNNTAKVSGTWQGTGVGITAGSVQVDATGSINADGQGYVVSAGPGGAAAGFSAGGSYGGLGGAGIDGSGTTVYPAAIYGSPTAPTDLGSGGGSRCCGAVGGAGGGALTLTVSGTLTDNGIISANGGAVIGLQGGGGSGGALSIATGVLAGSGRIVASGGAGGEAAGGGGRVALSYATNSSFNLALAVANGGSTSSGNPGAAGTVYVLGAGTNLTVSDNTALPANTTLNYSSITINNQGTLTLGTGTTLAANSITVSGGGTFGVGGGSTVSLSGAVLVTGNSSIVLHSLNNTTQINGLWLGSGVTMNAASVQVDAGSSINADGQGYVVSAGPGGAPAGLSPGGSYGGLGGFGIDNGGTPISPAAIYGSATAPTDLGSGGGSRCCGAIGGAGGGAMRLIVTGTLTNNGVISSNGAAVTGQQGGGGSGGSVLLLATTVAGAGSIAANGGSGGEASGGGGRVAVYYGTNIGFSPSLIQAGAGLNGKVGAAGTATFSNTPVFLWAAPAGSVLYGQQQLAWMAGAVDLVRTTVTIVASGPQIVTIGSGLNANSSLTWDTTAVPDGRYELRLIFHDANGNDIGEVPRTVVINNSIAWHAGTITSNQEWKANQVQGLNGNVIIPSGVTVTIDPGTVVKALPGSQIIVQSGGILNALGTGSLPVIFTAFDDSSAGGDSDFSAGQSIATPGEWNGISVPAGGQYNSNTNTIIRYVEATQSGTLPSSEAWPTDQLFLVTGTVIVPSSVTLTIQPGAVVKFAPNAGITVQPGGQLIALGTIAQPIYFTSVNDNSVGTTAAGSTGTPLPGDWASIIVNGGVASFNNVQLLYGGGPQTSQNLIGMVETGNSAVVTIANSVLGQAFADGLLTGYVNNAGSGGDTVTLSNSVVYGIEDRAIEAWPGSTLNVINDTLDGNNAGIQAHGGTINVANTIVTNSANLTWGGIDACGGGSVTVIYTDVRNTATGVPNYACMTDPTGTNGNISADPVYVNKAAGNYRLNYGSAAIDAGDGKIANYPLVDTMGDPRYTDPLVATKTGVADLNGNYPDMGAFEFVQTAASDIDLTVPSVTGPATALSGSQVQLTWTDTNTGSGTAQGPWHDAIYLIQDPDTNPVVLLAGEVLVAGGVTLGPGASFTATGTVRVPGSTVGAHRWEVVTNDRGEVFVGQNSAHSTGISLNTVALDLPRILVDGGALNNSFAATGQSWWYRLDPGANKSVSIALTANTGTTSPGAVQLFIGEGYVPTPQHYDFQQVEFNSPTASIVIPNTSNQTYYVTAYAQALTSAPATFSIAASTVQFSLTSVQPAFVSNFGSQTLTFQGGGFNSSGTYQLVGSGNTVYTASSVFITDSTHAEATFLMSGPLNTPGGVQNGTYTARVIENGATASLSNAVTVTTLQQSQAGGFFGTYKLNIQAPQEFRSGFPAEITLNYQNITGADQPAPVIWITATGANLSELAPACSGCNSNFTQMYQAVSTSGLVLGIQNQGPAGILPSGAQGSIKFLATPTGGNVTFNTQAIDPSLPDPLIGYTTVVNALCTSPTCRYSLVSTGLFSDAVAMCSAYMPPGYNAAGFSRTCMQFLANAGYTSTACGGPYSTQYCGGVDGSAVNTLLATDATALSKTGIYEFDATRLMSFELENDGLDLFNRRYHQGAFGFGKSHVFDITASIGGFGGAVLNYPDGATRYFTTPNPNQPNRFLGLPGDYGVLTVNTDGTWTVTESNGVVYHFHLVTGNVTGFQLLDYIQDLNGNRITMGYTNGLVTSAVDTVGNTISFVYDALGHITQSTDPVGRVTNYSYDIKSDTLHSTFLTSISNASGTTSFAWNEGGPSGVGYLGDSCILTYCEPAIGVNTITYPDGTHTYYTYDSLGRVASQYRDGQAEALTYTYGSAGAMTVTDASQSASQVIPNQYGVIAQHIDPLGAVTQLAYDPEQKLIGTQGPLGTSTSIGYDTQGNVALLLDPLGHQANLSSAANNSLQSFTDASGNPTGFTYDSRYNLTAIAAPDSTKSQSTYNSLGNVTSWTNRRGRTINFAYNSSNLLTSKTYANGSSVIYTYDGHQNLQTVGDSNGTTTFTYDSADRGTGVFYPNGQSIQYSYNAGGRRTSMVDSTGFTVQYAYDAAGRLSSLTSGTNALIVSYAYDPTGRLMKKTRGNGTYTTYAYDPAGHPLHLINYSAGGTVLSEFDYTYDALDRPVTMAAPSGAWTFGYDADSQITNVTLPGSTLAYTYDASGNRITGSGINYNVNNLNQYTAAGATAYQYDADGNLISGGGWTYTYDDENRLTGMVSATDTWAYLYDGLGKRIAATHNGTVTQYLNDPSDSGNVEAEFTGAGQLVSHYTYGLDLTSAVQANGSAAYYHFDAAGNTSQMTNASGVVVNSYTYLPFGEKIAGSVGVANPFTYVGQWGVMDEGSGLYYMRNRWYSPTLGRYVQADPTGLSGGDLNLYRYVGNSPANSVDPTGLRSWLDVFGLGIDFSKNPSSQQAQENGQAVYESGVASQSPAQRTAQVNNTIAGAAEQTLTTGVMLAAPAVGYELPEVVGNAPLMEGANHFGLHKGSEWLINKGMSIDEPSEPEEPGEPKEPGETGPGPNPEPGPAPVAPGKSNFFPVLKDMGHFFSGGLLFNNQPKNTDTVTDAHSIDPNGKLTSGFGDQGFVPTNTPILYTIYFENQPTATAPAVEVVVSDPLPSNLDWSTVQLNQIAFNNVAINVPAGLQTYVGQTSVSTDSNPVSIKAALNPQTGVLSWTMQSVDPTTGSLPANPLAGFLPPNGSGNLGTGYVTFSVKAKSGLANGTTISNQGSIVFDANASILTNTVINTIDSVYPSSSVNALPATTTAASFPISWSGTDPGGSGIAHYDIYVSTNSGAYTLWLPATTSTSGNYPGTVGQTYSFYSMATDNVGLRQQATGVAQTITVSQVASTSTPTVTVSPLSSSIPVTQALSVTVAVSGGNPVATGSVTVTSGSYSSAATTLTSGSATITVPAGSLALGADTLTANYSGDANYTSASGTKAVTVTAVAPSIAFTVPNHVYGDAAFTVTATSNSSGAITYSLVSGPATVSGSTVTLTGVGPVVLQAAQLAAGNFAAGSQTATFTVAAGAQAITFTAPASPVIYGAGTVALSASASSGLPITFSVLSGPASIGGSILTITGAGTVVVAADQAGNASYVAATEVTRSITVNKAVPTEGLSTSANPVLALNSVTLTATVASTAGSASGSIVFSDGGTPLGTAALSGGTATLTLTTLAVGSHSISAVYSGDANFISVSSTVLSESVQDFTVASGAGGSSQTVAAGGAASYALSVSPSGGTTFPAVVALSTSGLPAGFTATFSPVSIASGNPATNVALTIQVPATAMLENTPHPGRSLPLVALSLLMLPFLGGIAYSGKRLRRLELIAILLVGLGFATMLTGCGSAAQTNTAGATYTVTVTATSGALSHSTVLTLNVK